MRKLTNFSRIIQHFVVVYFMLTVAMVNGQLNNGLQPEERAYLFHIVKKSPILDNCIGRYFDFKGPLILLANKEINYDSTELYIINNPSSLIIRNDEIAKSSKGILAESANKMALWELNKLLLAKRGSEKEFEPYSQRFKLFEEIFIRQLPENALQQKNGSNVIHPKIISVLNPGLSFDDKVALLESFRFLDQKECLQTLEAMNVAINRFVESRSLEIYQLLGGHATQFKNVLVAAGDGSSTSGLLEEREKDEKGRWNKGLPKAVGLFPYQAQITQKTSKENAAIKPLLFTVNDFQTPGENRLTNLHFDVWGYNSKKQTTVVIEKNGLSYHLFGSTDTRFLSPDSSFSDGTTFQSIINDLEFNKIANIHESIFGKRGLDYWIAYNKKKKDAVEINIEKNEYNFSELSRDYISTSSRASAKVRKERKKAFKQNSGPMDHQPTTFANKKEKRKSQQTIVDLYAQFESYKKKIAELEKKRQEAIDLMAIYEQRLGQYKQLMGHRWASFTEKNGLYIFQDSSTFDMLTQDFTFPASEKKEDFEVRLLAIPESSLSKQGDEVMLHINQTDAIPFSNSRVQLQLKDVFDSDRWQLNQSLFTVKDSVSLLQFFEALANPKIPVTFIVRGQGIGKWNGTRVIKDNHPKTLTSYPLPKSDSSFSRLRLSELFINLNRGITIEINSYTDPVASNIVFTNETIALQMNKYGLTKNDLLSAQRSASIMKKFKEEINVLAGTYLDREKAKIIIDRFNKEWSKTKIAVGPTSFKMEDLDD